MHRTWRTLGALAVMVSVLGSGCTSPTSTTQQNTPAATETSEAIKATENGISLEEARETWPSPITELGAEWTSAGARFTWYESPPATEASRYRIFIRTKPDGPEGLIDWKFVAEFELSPEAERSYPLEDADLPGQGPWEISIRQYQGDPCHHWQQLCKSLYCRDADLPARSESAPDPTP